MSVIFSDVKAVIVAGATILALVPAVSILSGLTDMPPDFDKFLRFTVAVTGPVVLFLAFVLRQRLRALSLLRLVGIIVGGLLGGLWLGWESYEYTKRQILEIPALQPDGTTVVDRYVKPITVSAELHRLVQEESNGSWRHAVVGDSGNRVKELMAEESLPAQRHIAILLNSAQALLILSFLVAAFAVADRSPQRVREPAEDPAINA